VTIPISASEADQAVLPEVERLGVPWPAESGDHYYARAFGDPAHTFGQAHAADACGHRYPDALPWLDSLVGVCPRTD